jgi:hypothetical protein
MRQHQQQQQQQDNQQWLAADTKQGLPGGSLEGRLHGSAALCKYML